MNKTSRNIIFIIFIAITSLITVLYFYFKSYTPKYRWNESYLYDNQQPYGLKLATDILSSSYPDSSFVLINKSPQKFILNSDTNSLYIFIGSNYICDSILSNNIGDFVKRGNNAFISCITGEHYLFKLLTQQKFPLINYNTIIDSVINVSFDSLFAGGNFKFDFRNGKHRGLYEWTGLDYDFLQDSVEEFGFQAVSFIDSNLVDCMRVKYGKGWFIFHSNPIFFTNYNLSKETGYNYINSIFSEYKKSKILWDEFSKTSMDASSGNARTESPLRFILSERSLKWSWYLLCIFILIFVIFNSKRKQAPIPLVPPNKNTTIEYINSIAMLNYKSNSTVFLAEEMMKQFLTFAKHKYGISINFNKKDTPRILAPLSGIPEQELDKLFEYYGDAVYSPYNEPNVLVKLHSQIEYFYQNCK